jgi:tRNA pseudouridine55 synthase
MSSENQGPFAEGKVLLFDKPQYWTSFDLVNKVRIMIRSAFGIKKIKVGHAGTLDPLATGLMLICIGKATRRIEEFRDLDKEYQATFYLGKTTASFDLETEVVGDYPTGHITKELVEKVLQGFLGEQLQVPPLHSAKFIGGKRAYEFARKGIEMELPPVNVVFRTIELISFSLPEVKVRLVCSKGTYIRSFARDLGNTLNSGCYLSALERTSIGQFRLGDAYSLDKFAQYLDDLKQI